MQRKKLMVGSPALRAILPAQGAKVAVVKRQSKTVVHRSSPHTRTHGLLYLE